jgi:hypothetical protein
MYSDALLHPTLDASLLVAIDLYREIAGRIPRAAGFQISAPLLPGLARIDSGKLLSAQPQVAGDGTITHIEAARLLPLIAAVAADRESSGHE